MKFTPVRSNVIITAFLASGLLCLVYFVPLIVVVKDVIILVSGGLLALAGSMAVEPAPDSLKEYLAHQYRMAVLKYGKKDLGHEDLDDENIE